MSMLSRLTFSTVLIVTFLMGQTAWAATYYVDRNLPGSDSNSGLTEGEALRTIQAGINKASSPGDILYVKNGTYTEHVQIKYSGTVGNYITISNYLGHTPLIQFPAPTADTDNRVFFSSASSSLTSLHHVIFQGFEVSGGYDGMKADNIDNVIVRKNYVHDTAGQGFLVAGGYQVTIDANRFERVGLFSGCPGNPAQCNQVHGLYLNGKDYLITNNLIIDSASGWGMQLSGYPFNASVHADSNHADFTGTIANNTVAYSRYRGGIVVYVAGAVNTIIENNILYENNQSNLGSMSQGIDFYYSGSGHIVRNNLFYATTPGTTSAIYDSGSHYTASNNSINVSNPSFVNGPSTMPTSPNFSLQSGSPAIDKGLSLPLVTVDFAGVRRPQGSGHDIGAYEGDSSSSNAPPLAPQGLVAR